MNKNTVLYYKSASYLKLPVTEIEEIVGFEIKLGKKRYFFRAGDAPFNCSSSLSIANNKYCTNKILEASGFPTPKADAFNKDSLQEDNPEDFIGDLKFPLVLKPTLGTALGQDVLCNIKTIYQLKAYMKKRFEKYSYLSVEEFHGNLNSYRVLVFFNKVIGVVQRYPAQVVGDGIHSIKELMAIDNIKREKLKDRVSLGPLNIEDEEYHIRLKELNMTFDTIPKDQETVVLCYACNSTRGGTMKSLGKKICRENALLLGKAARALNLDLVGFDVACEDILIPLEKSRGVIIEANHNPDVTIHESPMYGKPNLVTKKILKRLIWRHPIAYCVALCRRKKNALYLRAFLIVSAFVAWKCVVT